MNSMDQTHLAANRIKRLINRVAFCGIFGLYLAQQAVAASALYQNDTVVNYPKNTSIPPVINATNFVNNGTFIIDFTTNSVVQPFYETSDTLNYTNTGLMVCNIGFQFDTRSSVTGNRSPASSFFNSGTINCKTQDDPGATQVTNTGPQCLVKATNIVVTGNIAVGATGLIQLTGQNMDLTRSSLTVEGNPTRTTATPDIGVNTDYDPSQSLTATTAESGQLNVNPGQLKLGNSTPFFSVTNTVVQAAPPGGGTNTVTVTNTIIRSVFIQDFGSPNVNYNVYFSTNGSANATVEWIGSYLNYATGKQLTNYLYLKNDYALSGSTNNSVNQSDNIPFNFQFIQSTTKITNAGLAKAGFTNAFQPGTITNIYAYVTAKFDVGTVSTNSVQNLAITNMPARVEISANGVLDMSLIKIAGPNYISVIATNQFNHSVNTAIQAPFVELNVGATNGFLTLSNTVNPVIPTWNGTVQAWSTSWVVTETNGNSTDYGVLIVGSFLHPTSSVQEQDLIVHGTNSVIISDTMNILRTLSSDTENLTLTANPLNRGAMSPGGELKVETVNCTWGSSFPNLRNLTNNSTIQLLNQAQFVGNSNAVTITPGVPAIAAFGVLSETNISQNVAAGNKVIIGTNTYTFVSTLNNSVANLVQIGSKFDTSMSNLVAAINHDSGSGSAYSSATITNLLVSAGALSNHSIVVTAKIAGPSGNDILTTNAGSAVNLTWNGHLTLFGGMNAVPGTTNTSIVSVPYLNFTNSGLISDIGSSIWAVNFGNGGTITNGSGAFQLNSQGATLLGGSIVADGDLQFTVNFLVVSNTVLQTSKSLYVSITNTFTDIGASNGNIWTIGAAAGVGLTMPIKAPLGDLLGTIINITATTNKNVLITWAGDDHGFDISGFPNNGYKNNQAIGKLVLDGLGDAPYSGQFTFTGTGAVPTNGLYVDVLELDGSAAFTNANYDATSLVFNDNLVLYYADARANGQSIAAQLNGKNNGHLQWVSNFVGNFSALHLVSSSGTTNVMNGAVAKQLIAIPTLSTSVQPGGAMKISVSGNGNYLNTIQASTNMVDWVDVYSGFPPFEFTDTNAANYPCIYYRVKVGQ
jgi:hypothetical protein